jgi:hypothetical protein
MRVQQVIIAGDGNGSLDRRPRRRSRLNPVERNLAYLAASVPFAEHPFIEVSTMSRDRCPLSPEIRHPSSVSTPTVTSRVVTYK